MLWRLSFLFFLGPGLSLGAFAISFRECNPIFCFGMAKIERGHTILQELVFEDRRPRVELDLRGVNCVDRFSRTWSPRLSPRKKEGFCKESHKKHLFRCWSLLFVKKKLLFWVLNFAFLSNKLLCCRMCVICFNAQKQVWNNSETPSFKLKLLKGCPPQKTS